MYSLVDIHNERMLTIIHVIDTLSDSYSNKLSLMCECIDARGNNFTKRNRIGIIHVI